MPEMVTGNMIRRGERQRTGCRFYCDWRV